jgi:hypothetical protein
MEKENIRAFSPRLVPRVEPLLGSLSPSLAHKHGGSVNNTSLFIITVKSFIVQATQLFPLLELFSAI